MVKPKGLRVFLSPKDAQRLEEDVFFCEHLRYMGVVTRIQTDYLNKKKYFQVPVPKGMDQTVWASQNIDRLRSFGVEAITI